MKMNAKATGASRALQATLIALLLGASRGRSGAQPANPDLLSARSVSGQFIAYAGHSVALPAVLSALATNRSLVQLEPTLTAVSCERIKQMLLRELGATAPWRGNIYLVLYPARSTSDTVTVTAERFKDRWQYRVDFPDVVERSRYVRVIAQVVLLEMANRGAATRAAELPLWLVEGFSQLLLSSTENELILSLPRATANGLNFSATLVNTHKEGLLALAQKHLRGRPPLTFEDLSWPPQSEVSGEPSDLYRGSAQLFVGELLRLPNGPACLRTMLAQLPQHYNWQFAFLGAFNAYFSRPLDVEKWWALSVAQATGRDITPAWTREESWQKLTQTIQSAAQLRFGTNELPVHAEVPLQAIIRDWDSPRQSQALNDTLRELALLRLRIDQEFVGLVQDYYQAIEGYLLQRDHPGSVLSSRKAARRRAAETAIQQLDSLDAWRESLRPATNVKRAT